MRVQAGILQRVTWRVNRSREISYALKLLKESLKLELLIYN